MKTFIGVGHVVKALQSYGFDENETAALREAMLADDFSKIVFEDDILSIGWDDSREDRQAG